MIKTFDNKYKYLETYKQYAEKLNKLMGHVLPITDNLSPEGCVITLANAIHNYIINDYTSRNLNVLENKIKDYQDSKKGDDLEKIYYKKLIKEEQDENKKLKKELSTINMKMSLRSKCYHCGKINYSAPQQLALSNVNKKDYTAKELSDKLKMKYETIRDALIFLDRKGMINSYKKGKNRIFTRKGDNKC